MRELPSRGRCHAAFLLASSARLTAQQDRSQWIESASSSSGFMAGAVDLGGTADILLAGGLASQGETVCLHRDLGRLSFVADESTFLGIAALLMKRFPPPWLSTVVIEGEVLSDLIPSADMESLEWLGDDLAPLLVEVHRHLTAQDDDRLRKQLGTAGELVVMSALRAAGLYPVHVALVSDVYGYDIEVATGGGAIRRIEVKSCVPATSGRILVSRNEFGKALAFGDEWSLVQVTFSTSAIVRGGVIAADVLTIREISAELLTSLAPPASPTFDWVDTAEFRPSSENWMANDMVVPAEFAVLLKDLG